MSCHHLEGVREGTVGTVRHMHNIISKIINLTDSKCSCKEWSTHDLDLLSFGLDPVNILGYEVLSFLHAAFNIAAICRNRTKRRYTFSSVHGCRIGHLYLVELVLILFVTLYSIISMLTL